MWKHISYEPIFLMNSVLWPSTKIKTYFPRAKHSSVILEASKAVVSGNFTLMSAGYFLSSPEAKKKVNYIQNVQCIGSWTQQYCVPVFLNSVLQHLLVDVYIFSQLLFANHRQEVRGWVGWTLRRHSSQWSGWKQSRSSFLHPELPLWRCTGSPSSGRQTDGGLCTGKPGTRCRSSGRSPPLKNGRQSNYCYLH